MTNDQAPSSDDQAPPPDPNVARAAAGLAQLTVIAESVLGYRRTLIEGGVAPDAADVMAQQYNEMILRVAEQQMAQANAAGAALASRMKVPRRFR